jgi:hypothetical protein
MEHKIWHRVKLDESDFFSGIHKMGVGLTIRLGNDTSGTALAHSLKIRRLPFSVCFEIEY